MRPTVESHHRPHHQNYLNITFYKKIIRIAKAAQHKLHEKSSLDVRSARPVCPDDHDDHYDHIGDDVRVKLHLLFKTSP